MVLRDLVTGGEGCSVNPLRSLSKSVLGSTSISQERLSELPRKNVEASMTIGLPSVQSLPGSECVTSTQKCQGSVFLQGFQSMHENTHVDGTTNGSSFFQRTQNSVDAAVECAESNRYENVWTSITNSCNFHGDYLHVSDHGSEFKTMSVNQRLSQSLEYSNNRSLKKMSEKDKRKILERINVIAKHFISTDDFRCQNIANFDGLGSCFMPSQLQTTMESSNQETPTILRMRSILSRGSTTMTFNNQESFDIYYIHASDVDVIMYTITGNTGNPGSVDMLSYSGLREYYDILNKKPSQSSMGASKYLKNVICDSDIRKGEGMELSEVLALDTGSTVDIHEFDMKVLHEAFKLRETGPVYLPKADSGAPTIISHNDHRKKKRRHKNQIVSENCRKKEEIS